MNILNAKKEMSFKYITLIENINSGTGAVAKAVGQFPCMWLT